MNIDKLVEKHAQALRGFGESTKVAKIKKERLYNRIIASECVNIAATVAERDENYRLETKLVAVTSVARGEAASVTEAKVKKSAVSTVWEFIKKIVAAIKEMIDQAIKGIKTFFINGGKVAKQLKAVKAEAGKEYSVPEVLKDDLSASNAGIDLGAFSGRIKEMNDTINSLLTGDDKVWAKAADKMVKSVEKGGYAADFNFNKKDNEGGDEKLTGAEFEALCKKLAKTIEDNNKVESTLSSRKVALDKLSKKVESLAKEAMKGTIAEGKYDAAKLKVAVNAVNKDTANLHGTIVKLNGRLLRNAAKLLKQAKPAKKEKAEKTA